MQSYFESMQASFFSYSSDLSMYNVLPVKKENILRNFNEDHSESPTECSSYCDDTTDELKVNEVAPPSRSVRFDESQNVEYESGRAAVTTFVEETWYTRRELKALRADLARTVNAYEQEVDSSFKSTLEELYDVCFEADLDEDQDVISELTEDEIVFLKSLYNGANSVELIGLEHHLTQVVACDVRASQQELQETVQEMQTFHGAVSIDEEAAAKEIRENCRLISHRQTLFAQYLARAQQLAQ